jgi:hypothetical protein
MTISCYGNIYDDLKKDTFFKVLKILRLVKKIVT